MNSVTRRPARASWGAGQQCRRPRNGDAGASSAPGSAPCAAQQRRRLSPARSAAPRATARSHWHAALRSTAAEQAAREGACPPRCSAATEDVIWPRPEDMALDALLRRLQAVYRGTGGRSRRALIILCNAQHSPRPGAFNEIM
ncbi:hypothetical protein NDU88_004953 [Pleurodeles waltl]|uniref:Uncharacterized protein n=1 Tax=Pleurodeles waltl TaxID=8319 RepID=A0AAV7NQ20_PLEWA|nr:hypothetical protein NDU88_004953 [Pleurodeles waltl]